ncbi:MAG: hypothetical protein ACI4OL_01455 [Gemmiger sp.]
MSFDEITLLIAAVLAVIALPILYRRRLEGKITMFGKSGRERGMLPDLPEEKQPAAQEKQRNGNQNDVLQMLASLMNLARRRHWYVVTPGELSDGKNTTALSCVLVTQGGAVGVKCYGYGGEVCNLGGRQGWQQTINGKTAAIQDPQAAQREQQAAMRAILDGAELKDVPLEIIAVYTTPGVILRGAAGCRCYTVESLLEELKTKETYGNGSVDPQTVGARLKSMTVQQDKKA